MRALRKAINSFKTWDIYGEQIQLNYRGETSYKTLIGGIFTFLTYAFIINFLVTSFIELSENENSIYVLKKEINLLDNPRNLTFLANDLEIATRLQWQDDEKIESGISMDRYWQVYFVSREYFYIDGYYQRKSSLAKGIECGYTGVSVSESDIEQTSLYDGACHPWKTVPSFQISGATASPLFSSYSMRIYDCNSVAEDPENECASH